MKKIYFLLVLFSFISSAQNFKERPRLAGALPFNAPLFSTTVISNDSLYTVYISYRIPYSMLVFEKKDDHYYSGFNMFLEVIDEKSSFVTRSSKESKLTVNNFDETNRYDIFLEEVHTIKLKNGVYEILPFFTSMNSSNEKKLKPISLNLSVDKIEKYLPPLVIDSRKINCDDKSFDVLANFEGNIPFSENDYSLIFPVKDTTISNIFVKVVNNKDTLFSGNPEEAAVTNINLINCDGKIVLSNGKNPPTKNFILNNISRKLQPGLITIFISSDKEAKPEKTFNKTVQWYNKPVSLNNPEFAIRALKYIEEDSVINRMLDEKEERYYLVLFDYWMKKDPDPTTSYNPLMKEYYERVDYAAINFTSIGGKNGIDSDRGKIFIQFGRPQKVERASNEDGKIVETWIYEKSQRRFIFVDQKGTGDFSLMKG